MARAIDAEKYMKLLKEQYLHNKSMGNSQAARAWQGAIQLLYDMPTLTPSNELRMINADKLAKRIAGHSNYHGDSILAAIYCAAEGKENDVPIRPIETLPNEPLTLEFDVVDTTTGKYPDWERIAREEAWAKGLVYCDMDGVAIREDGSLILFDECGNCVSCPPDRFEIYRPPKGEDDT